MEEQYKNNKIQMARAHALLGDLVAVWVISNIIFIAFFIIWDDEYITLLGFECIIPYFTPHGLTGENYSWKGITVQICEDNFFVLIGGYVMAGYVFLAALFISSPLQTTPVQALVNKFFSKSMVARYYVTAEGKRPEFHQGLRLMMISRYFFPLYLLYLYYLYHDFQTIMYDSGAIWTCIAVLAGLAIYEHFSTNRLLWDERFSTLRVHLTDKSLELIDKRAIRYTGKWYYKPFTRFGLFAERIQIFQIIVFFFFFLLAFNFLRDVNPPLDYYEVTYKRPAPDWNDNAYFALAGLDAPRDINDFYNYGRQKVHFNAANWLDFKNEIHLPYTHNVPDVEYTLFKPDEKEDTLEFDNNGIEGWDCLFNIEVRESAQECPAMADVLDLRDRNAFLWARFQRITDHGTAFSIPDMALGDAYYSAKVAISLVQLHGAHLVNLQAQGQTEKAMRAWLRYMQLYNNMATAQTNIVSKAVLMILQRIHSEVLETLLYNDPNIVHSYGDEIAAELDIDDISVFYASDMMADDWRTMEPIFIPAIGNSANIQRKLMRCYKDNQALAALSAHEYFTRERRRICSGAYPENVNHLMLKILIEPGNGMVNLIQGLLMGGVTKGMGLIAGMHTRIAQFRMAKVAMQLIQNDVAAHNVQAYLNGMPREYWNPITAQPFLWDAQKQRLYTPNQDDSALEPRHSFRIRLQ